MSDEIQGAEVGSVHAQAANGLKPRNPFVAVILALILGPLAQVYCGRLRRAFGWMLISLVLMICGGGILLYLPYGRAACGISAVLIVGYYLALVLDAYLLARRREPASRWYQRWWAYIGFCLFFLIATNGMAAMFRLYWSEAFYLPTGSMKETLLAGDRILVDKLRYRFGPIERDDVVVFWTNDRFAPTGFQMAGMPPQQYVKRVVGIPGDSVEIRNEVLYRNGAVVEEPIAYFSPVSPQDRLPLELREMAPLVVPAGQYFLLGDNRRNSLDSRMAGCIQRDAIDGKVVIVYWSREAPRIDRHPPVPGMAPHPEPPRKIRWNRIGLRIE